MAVLVRALLVDGPLSGKWRMLETGSGGMPPESIQISGLLGIPVEAGGVHRCVVYRRGVDRVPPGGNWTYSYDHDEPYRPFPPGLAGSEDGSE